MIRVDCAKWLRMAAAKGLLATVSLAALTATLATPASAARLWDMQGNWAQSSIEALVDKGVIGGYPDGSFRPDRGISRAEFAKVVVKAMGLPLKGTYDFTDVSRWHWANGYVGALADKGVLMGYPDGTFGPTRNVTRAEMVTVLTRMVGVADKAESYVIPVVANYGDVPNGNWAFKYVESSRKLGILPAHFVTNFVPARPVTRAETAHMVKSLTDLAVTRGTVAWIDPYSRSMSITKDAGGQASIQMTSLTTLFRNNVTSTPQALLAGDKVLAISRPTGEPLFVKAYGQVTKEDVLNKVSALTRGTLTPYQIQALVKGDWDSVKTDLSATLMSKLMEGGLQYNEANALMTQDWKSLEGDAKTRLSQLLSQQLGVTPDVIESLAAQDWQKAGETAKTQVTQALLQKLIAM